MADWRGSERFDEGDRLVLEFTETLTLHNRVDDDLYARLEEHFERRQLVRLAMTIALAGMVNRIHATFDTEVDAATLARQ
jgi:alkylhydroperoxidase family enzyme